MAFLRQFKKHQFTRLMHKLVQARLQRTIVKTRSVQIVMVAQQCGFLIKAILIVILKKAMGVTPTQYVARGLNL